MIPLRDEESELTTKGESSTSAHDGSKISNKASSSSTTSWSRLKDPRIVRVSRAFGGKDRHSKVCTVRGLRDRRVRLSVPTAIQLYDLQDRLGLNQPSKVVDWLLNAAKHEIDELPPLQIPQGSFINQNLQPFLDSQSAKQGLKIGDSINWSNDNWGKSKDLFSGERSDHREENWGRSDQEFQENHQSAYNNLSSYNFLSKQNNNPNPITNLLNSSSSGGSSSFPYNSFVRWDPSSLTLSHHPPRSHGLMMDQNSSPNFSLIPSGSHHPVLVYQPGISTQPYFPSHISPTDSDFTQKQLHFQSTSNSPISTSHVDSNNQPVRQFHFGMTADLLPRNEENKDNEFH